MSYNSGTNLQQKPGGDDFFMTDSNTTVGTGSQSQGFTNSGVSAANAGITASIAPAVAAGPTNLKSYDGNAKANIKSMFGNVIANVKSFDGNS